MKNLQLYGICRDYNATGDIMTFCCDCCYLLELESVWIVKWWVSCVCLRAREGEYMCFFSHSQHQNECESLNGCALLVLDEMNTNVTKKLFYEWHRWRILWNRTIHSLTMHKIRTMWAEYNLAKWKWKCLSPTYSRTHTHSFSASIVFRMLYIDFVLVGLDAVVVACHFRTCVWI